MIKIRFPNWDIYNPRGDVKKGTWLRFQNDFFTNPELFDFNVEEKLCIVYLLTQRSIGAKEWISVNESHAQKIGDISPAALHSTIEKLEKIQMIEVDTAASERGRPSTSPTNERTNGRTKRTNGTDGTPRPETVESDRPRPRDHISSVESFERQKKFDFRALLDRYPRRQKTGQALSALANLINDQTTYDDMATAIDHYRAYVERNRTPFEFQLAFPNFLNEWRDWLDPNNGTSDFEPEAGESGLNAETIGRILSQCRGVDELNEAVADILSQAESGASKSKYESIIKNWKETQRRGAQGPKRGDQ